MHTWRLISKKKKKESPISLFSGWYLLIIKKEMTRFKFGRKKKDADAEISMSSSDIPDPEASHSYLRRPSLLSKPQPDPSVGSENPDDNDVYEVKRPETTVISHVNGEKSLPAVNWSLLPAKANFSGSESATTPWKRHKIFGSPFPRYRHAALAISSEKNEIFLMGGLKEGSVFGDTWRIVPRLSISTNDIEAFVAEHVEVVNENNPPARVGHASVLCGNAYIVYGGDTVDTDAHGNPDNNFYMFNINNKKYTVPLHILNKPQGRYGQLLGAVLLSNASSRLYLFGGQLENDVYNDLYFFELTSFKLPQASWELVLPLNGVKPPPLTNHSMAVYKTRIYVFGGVYNNEKVSNDVWCFDTNKNKWLQVYTLGDVPPPVNEHSACIVGDNLYVYGGNDFSGTIYDSLHCLNLHSLKWTALGTEFLKDGPGPRCGHSMTYLHRLNKLIIMGGDKNDYIYSQASNYETYETFNGEEVGTMIYELDMSLAHKFMDGAILRKVAASAAGGAAGVLNRRAASPLPSEDAFTRHRRSLSGGVEDFQTPNASVEKFSKPLDPHTAVSPTLPEPQFHEPPAENFVDVEVASSSTSMNVTQELNEIRENYLESQDLLSSMIHNPHDKQSIDEKHVSKSQTPDFTGNFEPESPTFDGAHHDKDFETPDSSIARSRDISSIHKELNTEPEFGTGAIAQVYKNAALTSTQSVNSPTREVVSNGSPLTPTKLKPNSDSNVKQLVAQLTVELNELKASAKTQMETATAKIDALEQRNSLLEQQLQSASSRQNSDEINANSEKDELIRELKLAIDPKDLEINEDEKADKSLARAQVSELTKYKLDRLDLLNKLVYLENENSQLKEKHARFEPFMNNQIGEISILQKIIKGQEDRISQLSAQVKLELSLHKEIAEWKHKYEDLELEFDTYRNLNSEVYVSEDEDGHEVSKDLIEDGSSTNVNGSKKKGVSEISSHLENLVDLWQANSSIKDILDSVSSQDNELVTKLQSQFDDLVKTSKTQHEESSAEIQSLKTDLHSRLISLKSFEENYRDALQSVKNTSKALDLTQGELASQKLVIEKLLKENNELKLFKRATSASKKQSLQLVESGQSNGSLPSPLADSSAHDDEYEEEFTAAHYNMRLKDLEADLYVMKQDRDQLNDQVAALKKELYLARA